MRKRKIQNNLTAYAMIIPAMIIFLLFLVYPLLKAIQISFYDYSGIGKMTDFVGLENYVNSLADADFGKALLRTVKLAGLDLFFSLTIGFFLAYALYKRVGGWRFFSVALYIPAIVTVVVAGLIWRQIFEYNQGLLNSLLDTFGLSGLKQLWTGDMKIALGSVSVAWVWRTIPFSMIILYSSMLSIPDELIEAARIDGAGEGHIILHVILPELKSTFGVLVLYTLANDFRAFDMVKVLTDGGPGKSTEIITLYVYRLATRLNEYGYANAIAVETFLLAGGSVLAVFVIKKLARLIRKKDDE